MAMTTVSLTMVKIMKMVLTALLAMFMAMVMMMLQRLDDEDPGNADGSDDDLFWSRSG